jgi:hypothetical protein
VDAWPFSILMRNTPFFFFFLLYGFEIPALRWYIVHVLWSMFTYGDQRVLVTIPSSLESGTVVPYVCRLRSWFTTSTAVRALPYSRVSRREKLIESSYVFLALRFFVVAVLCERVCVWNSGIDSNSTFVLLVHFFKALLWKYCYLSRKECLVLLRSAGVYRLPQRVIRGVQNTMD